MLYFKFHLEHADEILGNWKKLDNDGKFYLVNFPRSSSLVVVDEENKIPFSPSWLFKTARNIYQYLEKKSLLKPL